MNRTEKNPDPEYNNADAEGRDPKPAEPVKKAAKKKASPRKTEKAAEKTESETEDLTKTPGPKARRKKADSAAESEKDPAAVKKSASAAGKRKTSADGKDPEAASAAGKDKEEAFLSGQEKKPARRGRKPKNKEVPEEPKPVEEQESKEAPEELKAVEEQESKEVPEELKAAEPGSKETKAAEQDSREDQITEQEREEEESEKKKLLTDLTGDLKDLQARREEESEKKKLLTDLTGSLQNLQAEQETQEKAKKRILAELERSLQDLKTRRDKEGEKVTLKDVQEMSDSFVDFLAGEEENEEIDPDIQVEACFPYMLYRLPVNDCQRLTYTAERSENYTNALLREIDASQEEMKGLKVRTLSLRGGAGLEEPKKLAKIVRRFKDKLPLARGCEISLHTNLGEWNIYEKAEKGMTVSQEKLDLYLKAGIRRFAVRAYSFSPVTCRRLGCLYAPELVQALADARKTNPRMKLCVELFFGMSWESDRELRRTMERLSEINPDEVRFFCMAPAQGPKEEGKDADLKKKKIRAVMKALSYQEFTDMTFACYRGESRELMMEEMGADRIGFGMGASTRLSGYRSTNTMDFRLYCQHSGDYSAISVPQTPGNLIDASKYHSLEELTSALTGMLKDQKKDPGKEKKKE